MPEYLDLASNFNRLGAPDGLIKHLSGNFMKATSAYAGDSMGRVDMSKVAEYFRLPADSVAITDGATEALLLVLRHFASKSVYIYQPSFWEYDFFAKEIGSPVTFIPVGRDNGVLKSIQDTIELSSDGVVVLCNPNNPTGNIVTSEEIAILAREHPNHTFIIDETYLWFVGDYRYLTATQYIEQQPNIVVVTSLSKICNIPGLRIGLLLADKKLLKQVIKAKSPYSVLPLQVEALLYIISSCHKFLAESAMSAQHDCEAIVTYLKNRPEYSFMPTFANYIFIGASRAGLADHMLKGGVRVRDGREFGDKYKNYIRMRLCAYGSEDWQKVTNLLDSFVSVG